MIDQHPRLRAPFPVALVLRFGLWHGLGQLVGFLCHVVTIWLDELILSIVSTRSNHISYKNAYVSIYYTSLLEDLGLVVVVDLEL